MEEENLTRVLEVTNSTRKTPSLLVCILTLALMKFENLLNLRSERAGGMTAHVFSINTGRRVALICGSNIAYQVCELLKMNFPSTLNS